ncbi:MAG: SoxR reducing system RseC family protein [Eubacteriales bacterium]
MIEKGEVIGTEGKLAFVKFIRTSACGNCTACGMSKDEKDVVVEVWNNKDVKKGEFVDVEIETQKAIASSAIAYVFPLVMLIAGAVVGYALGGGTIKMDKNILGGIFSIGFTLIAYLAIRLLEPVFKKRLKSTYKLVD